MLACDIAQRAQAEMSPADLLPKREFHSNISKVTVGRSKRLARSNCPKGFLESEDRPKTLGVAPG